MFCLSPLRGMLQGRLGPAYNLRDFLGDSRLTGPVEGQVQTLEHSPGVSLDDFMAVMRAFCSEQ